MLYFYHKIVKQLGQKFKTMRTCSNNTHINWIPKHFYLVWRLYECMYVCMYECLLYDTLTYVVLHLPVNNEEQNSTKNIYTYIHVF